MSFSLAGQYRFDVKEDSKPGHQIGKLEVEDKDEIQNKDPTFTIHKFGEVFNIKQSNEKDGILSLKVVSISNFNTERATIQLEFLRLSSAFNDFNWNISSWIINLIICFQPLDYETLKAYTFTVNVDEHTVSKSPDNRGPNLLTRAQVFINVIDVDEPPVFSQTEYKFSINEGPFKNPVIGAVSAKDPDAAAYKIRYKLNCIF